MRLTGGLALAAMILLLAACGQTTEQADPFVGTWWWEGSRSGGMIIAMHGDEYDVAMYDGWPSGGWRRYTRQDDRLLGRFPVMNQDGPSGRVMHITITIELDPSLPALTYREMNGPSLRLEREVLPKTTAPYWPTVDERWP